MNARIDLMRIVKDWWTSSEWTEGYRLTENRFSCKCCCIIVMKVESDRVVWGRYPKEHDLFQTGEIMAADPKLFDLMVDVFKNSYHDRVRAD